MSLAAAILAHTPPYVFVLLAFLVWQGLKATRPQTVGLPRLLIVPLLFIALGLSMLVLHRAGVMAILTWIVPAILLAPLGYATGPRLLAVDPATKRIRRPGSPLPLIRNVTVFALQYSFAVLAALHPDRYTLLFLAGRAVSGATAGYFLGWLLALRRHYRTAPRLALAA